MKYIDNTSENQSVVSLISLSTYNNVRGVKYRLCKVLREIDSTYNLSEAVTMVINASAVIEFDEYSELGILLINSGLKVVDKRPVYNYLNTSKSPELYLI